MTQYQLKTSYIETIATKGKILPPINLGQLAEKYPDVYYRPEQFPAAEFPLRNLSGRLRHVFFNIFRTGNFLSSGAKSEQEIGRSVAILRRELSKEFPIDSIDYSIINVVGTGYLNDGFEFGVMQTMFPDCSVGLAGTGIRTAFGKGKFAIYDSGKIVAIRHRSVSDFKTNIADLVAHINQSYENALANRRQAYMSGRVEPTISEYDSIIKAAELEGKIFASESSARGKQILDAFFEKTYNTKGKLGVVPKTLAAAAAYIAFMEEKNRNNHLSQETVAGLAGMANGRVILKACRLLKEHVGDLFEINF